MNLSAAFRAQATSCRNLGSPFMARLMDLLAARLTQGHGIVAARLFDWPGNMGGAGASLPLRLAGGLHALALDGHQRMRAVYPPWSDADDDALWEAVSTTLTTDAAFLRDWIDSPPQTNEIRRSAVLRAAGQWLSHRYGLPLQICELGASAGLNLNWDRYALAAGGMRSGPADAVLTLAPDWTGPPPPAVEPIVADRRGVDLNPLSPVRDALRLRAYTWPDQPDRMARLDAALALPANRIDCADAADWLEALPGQEDGTLRMICHTVAWQYFSQDTATRARRVIERMGDAATPRTPLAWFAMEGDGGEGAGLTLRCWPGDVAPDAGRCDFHGRRVAWRLE